MKKLLLILAVVSFVVIAGGSFYFNTIFLPNYLTRLLSEKGEYMLGRKVSFGKIEYALGKGLTINGLKIAQKDDPGQTLFTAERISSRIPLTPLVKNKQLILAQILVQGFSANLNRTEYELWNFADLLHPKYAPAETEYQLLLGRLILTGGRIHVTDQARRLETTDVTVDRLEAGFALPKKINFTLSAGIKAAHCSVSVNGSYVIDKKSLSLKAKISSLDLAAHILPVLPEELPLPIQTEEAFIRTADISATFEKDLMEFHGDLDADLKAALEDTLFIEGGIRSQGTHVSKTSDHLFIDINALSSDNIVLGREGAITFSGALNAEAVEVTQENGTLLIKAGLAAKPSSIRTRDASLTTEQITMNSILLKQTDDELTVETSLTAPALVFDRENTHISGDLVSPAIKASLKNEILKLSAPFVLEKGKIEQAGVFTLNGPLTCDLLDIVLTQERMDISGLLQGERLAFTLPEGRSGTLTPISSFKVIQDRTQLHDYAYDISTNLSSGKVLNAFPLFKELKNIRGKTHITNGNIVFDNLLLDIGDTAVSVNGQLRTFTRFIADLAVSAKNIRIEDWLPIVKDSIDPYNLNIDGKTDVTLQITGPLAPPERPEFIIEADLKEANISSTKYPYAFSKVRGFLKYKKDLLAWDSLKFQFSGEPYDSSGSLKNFAAPAISIRLKSPSLFFTASAESVEGIYEVSRFDIKTKTSALSGSGRITPDMAFPHAELKAKGSITLSDLKRIHPVIQQKIDEWDLRGTGYVNLTYTGNLSDPANARYSMKYQSAYTGVKNLRFENISLEAQQTSPMQDSFLFVSNLYDGKLSVKTDVAFKDDFPFKLQAQGVDINIAKLKNDFAFRDKPLGGLLTADLYLEGPAKKTIDITGQGRIKIEKGYFTKTNLLKGILALILNTEAQDTTFTDARAKFFIRDNKAKLKDIFLSSKAVQLSGNGWIDINQKIDLSITPNFTDVSNIKPSLLKDGTKNLLEKYSTIRVTGTLSQPKYSSNIDPGAVAQDAVDMISDGVQSIFEGFGL